MGKIGNRRSVDNSEEQSLSFVAEEQQNYTMVKIDTIIPDPTNKTKFSTEQKESMYLSIKRYGLRQHPVVTKISDTEYLEYTGHTKPFEGQAYMLKIGHRRWMACMRLYEEGDNRYAYIPCEISDLERDELEAIMDETNAEVRNLTPPEEAGIMMRRWERYLKDNHKTHSKNDKWFKPYRYEDAINILVKEYGYSKTAIQRYLRIDPLPEFLKDKYATGQIPIAVSIQRLEKYEDQFTFDQIIDTMSTPGEESGDAPKCLLSLSEQDKVINGILEGKLTGDMSRKPIYYYLGLRDVDSDTSESDPKSAASPKLRKPKKISDKPTFVTESVMKYKDPEKVSSLKPEKKEEVKTQLQESIECLTKILEGFE